MAVSNHERVGKALELLKAGLGPFVEREIKGAMASKRLDGHKLRHYAEDPVLASKSIPDWDVAGLLKLMWETWNEVFRQILGPAERGLVGELRGHRNQWAHQESFSSDDAYRALDSVGRLLVAVAAPQSAELERLKMELLHVRFDEQTRGARRKQAGTAIDSAAADHLKPWREIVTPHQDVASGRYQQAEFAADLWQVHLGEGTDEYRDAVEFFRRTYLTESLKGLLVGAIHRLTGTGGDPVVQLQTNFGGGRSLESCSWKTGITARIGHVGPSSDPANGRSFELLIWTLYYFMQSREFMSQWSAVKGETDMADYVSLTAQRRFVVPLPPIVVQRTIASVLGSLDNKIEQNRRTAMALERLARAIFRAWFVDFEPVKAKAEGAASFPSMPREVFDALPTRFVDSDIGAVPEGWEVKAIGEVVTLKGGGTPSTKSPEFWDGGEHCWATPKDMSRLSHPVLLDTERHITEAGVNVISSRTLPAGTVLMSSRAPVGYLAIAGVPTAINQGFIAMVCDGPLPPTYVLNWAFTSMDAITARASGTTFPEISKKNFRPLPVVQPTTDVLSAYQQTVDPLFDLLIACVKENEQLAAMRDYLLPKLLSGDVRVEADEALVRRSDGEEAHSSNLLGESRTLAEVQRGGPC